MINHRVLAIGPRLEPVTGQSLSFFNYIDNSSLDLEIICYGVSDSFKSKMKDNILFVFNFLSILCRKKFDIVYFTSSRSFQGFLRDFVVVVASDFFGLKVVNHLHGADFKAFYERSFILIRRLVDFVYKKINLSIILSESMADQYSSYFHRMDLRVVPNCYSGLKIYNHKECVGTLKLLYLSNIIKSKGIIDLVEAVGLVRDCYEGVELKVAGEFLPDVDMSASEVKKQFNRVGAGVCEFLGPVHGEEKSKLLNWADCLVLPTYYASEAQPICIIEAMAAGCYIISTKHNYIEDLVGPENGSLVNAKSIVELKRAIIDISGDRGRLEKVKRYNRKFAQNNYSLSKYVERIDQILTSI